MKALTPEQRAEHYQKFNDLNNCGQYLLVFVYKNNLGDCTNGGITSTHDVLYVPCHDGNISREDLEERGHLDQALWWKPNQWGDAPLTPSNTGNRHSMFGGNYVCTSDSRFSAISRQPVAVHDRFE